MWFEIQVDAKKEEVVYGGKVYKANDCIFPDDTGLTWELRKTKLYGFHICHFIGSNFIYQVPLKKDGLYHLGSKFGYRETLASEEPCAIKRVLRKYRLSVSKLTETDLEQTTLRRSSYALDREAELPSGSKAKSFITDGESTVENDRTQSGHTKYTVSNFNYVIEYTLMHGRHGYMYMIEEVLIKPGAHESIRLEVADKLETLIEVGFKSVGNVRELIKESDDVFRE